MSLINDASITVNGFLLLFSTATIMIAVVGVMGVVVFVVFMAISSTSSFAVLFVVDLN